MKLLLHSFRPALLAAALAITAPIARAADADGFTPLFTEDGAPKGWTVRAWNDVKNPPEQPTKWTVVNGILQGGERGNSGCALRVPMRGDPAFDGIELQMADFRYNPQAKDSELTGGLYRAVAPKKQVYKPTEWNKYQITLKGAQMKVILNGELIQDLNLDEHTEEVKRHDGKLAPPIKDRPRKGHLGFQELSRGEGHAQIRNARIKVLE